MSQNSNLATILFIKYLKYSLLLAIIALICECQNKNDNTFEGKRFKKSDFSQIINLKGTVMQFDSILWKPIYLSVKDSLLILKNFRTEFVYDIFNLNTNKHVNTCLTYGQGSDEKLNPSFVSSDDENIWIYDVQLSSLDEYKYSDFITQYKPQAINHYTPKDRYKLATRLSDNSMFVEMQIPRTFKFAFCDYEGNIRDTLNAGLPFSENMEKYVSFATTNKKDIVFVTYHYADIIDIYDFKGNLKKRLQGPDGFKAVMGKYGDGMVSAAKPIKGETYRCYMRPEAVDDEVFVMYYGDLGEKQTDNLYNKILVYNWDGKPQRIYNLDIPVFIMTVDSKTKTIYGITDKPEFQIIKYKY